MYMCVCVCVTDVYFNTSRLFSYSYSPAVARCGHDYSKCNLGNSRSSCIPSLKGKIN